MAVLMKLLNINPKLFTVRSKIKTPGPATSTKRIAKIASTTLMSARIFMPAFGLLGIDFGYGLDSVNEFNLEPNGWETHFVIGQQF